MARRLKSPTRTISNRGDHPRFVGEFSSPKSPGHRLVFDSLSSLLCGMFLEWRRDVVSFLFEPHVVNVTDNNGCARAFIPDYEVVFDTGELGYVEAKYDPQQLRESERLKLAAFKGHCDQHGMSYEIVYRSELEREGFVQTILFLRRYQQAQCSNATLKRVLKTFEGYPEATLPGWRQRTQQKSLPWAAVCKLLYSGELPLRYEPIQALELEPWLD